MSNDMTQVIIPKSDQINADDFLGGPMSYVIERVAITPGSEQPVSISLRGERRVWRPCKSMSRVLVAAWGSDAKEYAGRSVTLYRDASVKWGGLEVGGIRISHMSHIERDMMLQLTATKGKRSPHIVRPMREPEPPTVDACISEEEVNSIMEWIDVTATDAGKFLGAFGVVAGFPGPKITGVEQMTAKQYEAAIRAFEKKAKKGTEA